MNAVFIPLESSHEYRNFFQSCSNECSVHQNHVHFSGVQLICVQADTSFLDYALNHLDPNCVVVTPCHLRSCISR